MKELFYDSTLQKFNGAWEFLSPSGEKSAVELPHGWNTIGWSYEADQNLAPSGTGVYTKKEFPPRQKFFLTERSLPRTRGRTGRSK